MSEIKLFDVFAIDQETLKMELVSKDKTEGNANAIVETTVLSNGCEEQFFVSVPSSSYKEGDVWEYLSTHLKDIISKENE